MSNRSVGSLQNWILIISVKLVTRAEFINEKYRRTLKVNLRKYIISFAKGFLNVKYDLLNK